MSRTSPTAPAPDRRHVPGARLVQVLRAAGCVFAEDEARLLQEAARTPAELDVLVERRVSGVPLEHVLGQVEFGGVRILLDDGVFVPRRRTELLVREGTARLRRARTAAHGGANPNLASPPRPPAGGRPVVVDLCCGSGAVGVAIAASLGGIELHAVDIDAAAVACARRNLAPVGGHVHLGDLYAPLPRGLAGRVDLLAVNAPYVPTAEIPLMPAEARLHEPRTALDGGADGLDVHRRVAAGARRWLSPGGTLVIETSETQASATHEAVEVHGLTATVVSDRVLGGTVVVATA